MAGPKTARRPQTATASAMAFTAGGRALHGGPASRRGFVGDYCAVSMLSVLATLAVVSWTGPPLQRPRLHSGASDAALSR